MHSVLELMPAVGNVYGDATFDEAATHVRELTIRTTGDNSPSYDSNSFQGSITDAPLKRKSVHTKGQEDLTLRLVIVPLTSAKAPYRLGIRQHDFDEVIASMNLSSVMQYAQSAGQTFNVFPRPDGKGYLACFSIQNYIDLYINHDASSATTEACCWGSDSILPLLEQCVLTARSLSQHPYFLLYAATASFLRRIDDRLHESGTKVAEVERQTGFLPWEHYRSRSPDSSEPDEQFARMSGLATILAANKRLLNMCQDILNLQHRGPPQLQGNKQMSGEDVQEYTRLLQQQHSTAAIHLEFVAGRVQNQLTALFNLSNQRDMAVSISIARSSRILAAASKHDSSSMKTLAAVTVVFLPGTFVAALFSMSMFDFSPDRSDGRALSGSFWIYWVVTIPLTIVVVGIWLAWTQWRERTRQRHEVDLEMDPKGDL